MVLRISMQLKMKWPSLLIMQPLDKAAVRVFPSVFFVIVLVLLLFTDSMTDGYVVTTVCQLRDACFYERNFGSVWFLYYW